MTHMPDYTCGFCPAVVLFRLLVLIWLLVLPLVRFDPNSGCRLLSQTRVPWPRSEGELHSTLQPPAAHPLQADGAERSRSPCTPEQSRWRSRVSATRERRHLKRPDGASRQWSSPWQPSQRLQTRGETEATLLWKTEEMYVRAISRWSPHGSALPSDLTHNPVCCVLVFFFPQTHVPKMAPGANYNRILHIFLHDFMINMALI